MAHGMVPPEKVYAWEERGNVQLVERKSKPDLAASILAGVAVTRSNAISWWWRMPP